METVTYNGATKMLAIPINGKGIGKAWEPLIDNELAPNALHELRAMLARAFGDKCTVSQILAKFTGADDVYEAELPNGESLIMYHAHRHREVMRVLARR